MYYKHNGTFPFLNSTLIGSICIIVLCNNIIIRNSFGFNNRVLKSDSVTAVMTTLKTADVNNLCCWSCSSYCQANCNLEIKFE